LGEALRSKNTNFQDLLQLQNREGKKLLIPIKKCEFWTSKIKKRILKNSIEPKQLQQLFTHLENAIIWRINNSSADFNIGV
jgi:G:T-mismatch repair DNA endonuclease (very short patch repair protein)